MHRHSASLSLDDGCDPDTRPGHDSTQCLGNNNNQNALVEAIAKAQKNTVVVLSIPGAILMPWSPNVPAILTNFMPGTTPSWLLPWPTWRHPLPGEELLLFARTLTANVPRPEHRCRSASRQRHCRRLVR